MKLLPFAAIVLTMIMPAQGQEQSASWVEQKCGAYEAAWTDAVAAADETQVNYAFIAGGCTEPVEACPRSRVELDIANALTLAMMNAGAASTFLPFRCPVEPADNGWSGPGL